MTSHIRHFYGFVLTADVATIEHVKMVLRPIISVVKWFTSFVIVPRLLLVVLADHLQSRASRGLGSRGQENREVDSLVEVLNEMGLRAVKLRRLRQVLSELVEFVRYLL
ncbi:hypothetical protein ACFX1Q_030239 [Malus domestica]